MLMLMVLELACICKVCQSPCWQLLYNLLLNLGLIKFNCKGVRKLPKLSFLILVKLFMSRSS